jgi:hypothetical protein
LSSPNFSERSSLLPNIHRTSNYKRENEVDSKDHALEHARIATLLPLQKDFAPVSGLLGLLQVAITLDCSVACKKELEKRSGMQLDQAAAMSSSWLTLMIMLSPTAKILCLPYRFKELL